ncbi:MAG: glycosyltransferase family 9 protein [Parvibaculales bacterium]
MNTDSRQQNILILKLGAFGDVMMSDGAFRDIRRHHPDACITVLTTAPYRKIMEACPHVDAVMLDPRAPRWKFWILNSLRQQLQNMPFDRVYDLQDNARTALYFKWMRQVPAWSGTQRGASHRHTEPDPKSIPALDRMAGQLAAAGVETRHTLAPDLTWMGHGLEDATKTLLTRHQLNSGFVLLIPGASRRHPQKRWPYYAELADWLIKKGLQVVTAPGPDELDLCAALPGTTLLDEGRPLSFFQLAALVPHAGFVVGNDTGPTHLAAHTGTTKGLALFGGHTPARLTCVDRKFEILEKQSLAELSLDSVTTELSKWLPAKP